MLTATTQATGARSIVLEIVTLFANLVKYSFSLSEKPPSGPIIIAKSPLKGFILFVEFS